MNVRKKPTKELRESTHSASEADYQALARAVVERITLRKKDIFLKFIYFAEFADDWPKGVLVKKDGLYNTYKCKTYKVADWLHSKGFLPTDAKGIMLAQRDWGYREARLTRMLTDEIGVDNTDKNLYNDGSVEDKEEE